MNSGPFGGKEPIGPLSGFWLVPLLVVAALVGAAFVFSPNTMALILVGTSIAAAVAASMYNNGRW